MPLSASAVQATRDAGSTMLRSSAQAAAELTAETAPMEKITQAMGSLLELSARTHILAAALKKACGGFGRGVGESEGVHGAATGGGAVLAQPSSMHFSVEPGARGMQVGMNCM